MVVETLAAVAYHSSRQLLKLAVEREAADLVAQQDEFLRWAVEVSTPSLQQSVAILKMTA